MPQSPNNLLWYALWLSGFPGVHPETSKQWCWSLPLMVHAANPLESWKDPLLTAITTPALMATSKCAGSPCCSWVMPQSSSKVALSIVVSVWNLSMGAILVIVIASFVVHTCTCQMLSATSCSGSSCVVLWNLNCWIWLGFWCRYTIALVVSLPGDHCLSQQRSHLAVLCSMSSCLGGLLSYPFFQVTVLPSRFCTIYSIWLMLGIPFMATWMPCDTSLIHPKTMGWLPSHHWYIYWISKLPGDTFYTSSCLLDLALLHHVEWRCT